MKRIVKIIISIFLSIAISLAIFYAITGKKVMINMRGISTLIVSSGSMTPELQVGDIIIIQKCDDYNVGDIVTYIDSDGSYITHRIIEKEGANFVTKGDSNNTQDSETVSIEDIQGKLIVNSKLLKWIYNNWLIITLIILIICIIL